MTTMKKPCDQSGIPGSRTLAGISDNELIGRIRKLSLRERETVLSILSCLIEIDRRRLYLPRGYSLCML